MMFYHDQSLTLPLSFTIYFTLTLTLTLIVFLTLALTSLVICIHELTTIPVHQSVTLFRW